MDLDLMSVFMIGDIQCKFNVKLNVIFRLCLCNCVYRTIKKIKLHFLFLDKNSKERLRVFHNIMNHVA